MWPVVGAVFLELADLTVYGGLVDEEATDRSDKVQTAILDSRRQLPPTMAHSVMQVQTGQL
jgi:hypothetical protein